MRPPRRLRFTREGKYFVGITFGVGFAAINTGNNLLYLLLGMLLSLIIASGILSEVSLRGVTVKRFPPARVHAKMPFLMTVELTNTKLRFPSFSVEVEDLIEDRRLDKKCYFLKLPAGKQQRTSYRHQIGRRGLFRFTALRVSTKFPFGLFRKSRMVPLVNEVLVFPQVVPIARVPLPLGQTVGDRLDGQRGRHGEFYGLREFREGDDPRDIHWVSSARRGRAVVREYQDEAARRVSLFLENALPEGAATMDENLVEAFERSVNLCASLAADYLDRGYSLRLVTRGEATGWLKGAAQLPIALRMLALLQAVVPEVPFFSPPERRSQPVLVSRRGARTPGFHHVVET
jgi:uncharacterized protein (DUF58 family)